jgi:hypothetical protein
MQRPRRTKMIIDIEQDGEIQKYDINEIRISKDRPDRIVIFSLYNFSIEVKPENIIAVSRM